MTNSVQYARDLVGVSTDEDYVLKPSQLSTLFSDDTDLTKSLNTSAITTAATLYKRHDEAAIVAQSKYNVATKRAISLALSISIISIVLMVISAVSGTNTDSSLAPHWQTISIIASSLIALLSFMTGHYVHKIRSDSLLTNWMQNRAKAETNRQQYFSKMWFESLESASIDIKAVHFELFRRYQFELQQHYYDVRAKEHKSSAEKLAGISRLAMICGGLGAAGGAVGAVFGQLVVVWVSAVAALASALTAYVSNFESIYQYTRTASRYESVNSDLIALGAYLDEVRDQIEKNNYEPATRFIVAVNELLANEHQEWLGDAKLKSEALKEFHDSIQES